MIAYRIVLGLFGALLGGLLVVFWFEQHQIATDVELVHTDHNEKGTVGAEKQYKFAICYQSFWCKIVCIVIGSIFGFIGGALELAIFFAIYLEQTEAIRARQQIVSHIQSKIQSPNWNSNQLPEMSAECGPCQKGVQLTEAVLESLPEVIMQSVFMIRSVNDPYLRNLEKGSDLFLLIIISIIASIISVTNKYVWIDDFMVTKNCQSFFISDESCLTQIVKDKLQGMCIFVNVQ